MTDSRTVELNNGVEVPVIGLGTWRMDDREVCEAAVKTAIEEGYRLIDTAAAYLNEEYVGNAIRSSGLSREKLFITTKLWVRDHGYDQTKKAFDRSLGRLKLTYVDMYLIHWPVGDYLGSWKAMESLYREGKVRAIGVCNFPKAALLNLMDHAEIKPAVDQVETHPVFQQKKLKAFLRENQIRHEAWGPLFQGRLYEFSSPALRSIAQKYNKTEAQVILRWHVQEQSIAVPKSVHKARLAENLNIFDFKLSKEDMAEISSLDTGRPLSVSPDDPVWLEKVIKWDIDT